MNRSTFGVVMIVAAMGFGLAGCHTTPQSDEKRQALDANVQSTLDTMRRTDPSLGSFLD